MAAHRRGVVPALPRTPENWHLVIEAKRLGAGVEGALRSGKGICRGARDSARRDRHRWHPLSNVRRRRGFAPVAYANLARLKQPAADLFARMQRP